MECKNSIKSVREGSEILGADYTRSLSESGRREARIDAVIPLLPKDLGRFLILIRSLERFMHDLGTLFVVVPDKVYDGFAPRLLSESNRFRLEVVPEGRWIPEMNSFFHLPGWYKQQLVKLAAAEFVSNDFFLTLDADVICTRKVTYSDLVSGGRAPCHVINNYEQLFWYRGAESVLNLKACRRNMHHNVTPCVLSRKGILELIAHLNRVAYGRHYATDLRGVYQRALFAMHRLGPHRAQSPWRGWLAASLPWSEYAIYFTFLEATGRFEDYHFESKSCVYDVTRSVWRRAAGYKEFDPAQLFEGSGPPFFVVIQSNTGIEAEWTWKKLSPFLLPAE